MKLILIALLPPVISLAADEIKCTEQSREMWMKSDEMKKKAQDMGYKIKTFKTLEHCFQVLGTDKNGKKVEVYFNPVDGSIVKAK